MNKVNTALLQGIWLFSSKREKEDILINLILRLHIKTLLNLEHHRKRKIQGLDNLYSNKKSIFTKIIQNTLTILGFEDDLKISCEVGLILDIVWGMIEDTQIIYPNVFFEFSNYDPSQSQLEKFYSMLDCPFIEP